MASLLLKAVEELVIMQGVCQKLTTDDKKLTSGTVTKVTDKLWKWYLQDSSGGEAMHLLPAFHSNSTQSVHDVCPITLF